MVNVAFEPAHAAVLAGSAVTNAGELVVKVAAAELMLPVVQSPPTWQRYWLLFMPDVTPVTVSVAVVTAGATLFQVVPPSVLTCQL